MPDSVPPFGWGPAAFDEWDLDTLLSGEAADPPPALRQVADALSALRAAPAPAELRGEATIVAEFRALAEFRAPGPGRAQRTGGQAHTLVLPAVPCDARPRQGARHRSRRGARPVSWRMGMLMGAAAAAVIVTLVAFAGSLPGPIKDFTHTTSSSSAARPTVNGSGSQSVTARSASPVAVAPSHPAARHPDVAPSPAGGTLCREYFGRLWHLAPRAGWSAESAIFRQLSSMAGGPANVRRYCARYLDGMSPHGYPWSSGGIAPDQGGQGSTNPGPGGQGNDGNGQPGAPSPPPTPAQPGA